MGNVCDQHLDSRPDGTLEETELPLHELQRLALGEDYGQYENPDNVSSVWNVVTTRGHPAFQNHGAREADRKGSLAQVLRRVLSMQACGNKPSSRHEEIPVDGAEGADDEEVPADGARRGVSGLPDCMFLERGEEEELEEEELDFSKDRHLHDKRVPAVFLGRDAKTGEAKYRMPSPTRSNAKVPTPEIALLAGPAAPAARIGGLGGATTGRSTPSSLQRSTSTYALKAPVSGSFARSESSALFAKTSVPRSESSALFMTAPPPRSESSFVCSKPAEKTLKRSDSSYVVTKTLQRSNSSYLFSANHVKVSRSKSAPALRTINESGHQLCPAGPLVEDLMLESFSLPDFCIPPLREKLFAAVAAGPTARIERMAGFSGGQNKGMWMIHDVSRTLVIKMVAAQRRHGALPTEAEQLIGLLNQHPSIRSDPTLAFPIRVLLCRDGQGGRQHDLIVMAKAAGKCLSEVIAVMTQRRQVAQLLQIFESLGRVLAGIHNRYEMNHGDFQPNNVFYDQGTGHFTLVDLGGMALDKPGAESDVEHFGESLRILARGLQTEFFNDAYRHFQSGYAAAKC